MRERTKNLDKFMTERANKDAKDIKDILEELEKNIRAELDSEMPSQLTLWSDPEREQLERNRSALAARVAEIPNEIKRETEAIKARYRNPTPRLFPVAVMFHMPESLARKEEGKR